VTGRSLAEVGQVEVHAWRETLAKPWVGLLFVVLCYGIAQIWVADLRTFLGWDEAVYVSEVSRFTGAVGMAAHRSRGITLVVAPVTLLTDSVVVLRAYLIVFSSVALFVSFYAWVRLIGWAAPAGAAVFATSWMTLFFGGQVSPNIYAALGCIAAVALGLRHLLGMSTRALWAYVALAASVAFIRPLDGLSLMVGMSLAAVLLKRSLRQILAFSMASAVGFATGVLPWIVEAYVTFGGPLQRLDRARELVGGGVTNNFTEYLNLLDGPIVWTGTPDGVTVWAVLWLGCLGVLAVVATRSLRYQPINWCLLLVSCFLALPYAIGADVAAPRFMLPALATLSLVAGMGILSLRPMNLRVPVLIGVLVLGVAWNLPVYERLADAHLQSGERVKLLGEALRAQSEGEECFFLSPGGHPQISVASGCDGSSLMGDPEQDDIRFDAAEARGLVVLALVPPKMFEQFVADRWICGPVEGLEPNDWHMCQPSS
jgi:hypothetical protein